MMKPAVGTLRFAHPTIRYPRDSRVGKGVQRRAHQKAAKQLDSSLTLSYYVRPILPQACFKERLNYEAGYPSRL